VDRPEWEGGETGVAPELELEGEVETAVGDEVGLGQGLGRVLVAGNVTFGMVLFAPAKRRVELLI